VKRSTSVLHRLPARKRSEPWDSLLGNVIIVFFIKKVEGLGAVPLSVIVPVKGKGWGWSACLPDLGKAVWLLRCQLPCEAGGGWTRAAPSLSRARAGVSSAACSVLAAECLRAAALLPPAPFCADGAQKRQREGRPSAPGGKAPAQPLLAVILRHVYRPPCAGPFVLGAGGKGFCSLTLLLRLRFWGATAFSWVNL